MVCKRDTFVASSERMPRVGEVLLLWPVVVSKSGVRRRRRRQHRWTTSVAGATAGRGLVAAAATAARRRRLQVGRVVEPAVIDVEATRRRRTTRLFRLLGRMHAHRQTYTRPNIHTKTLHTTSRLHFLMHCCLPFNALTILTKNPEPEKKITIEMWANAQRDGSPAEYR